MEKFLALQLPETPFFAMVAPPAPHAPFTPAKRHVTFFSNVTALRTPNFNIESKELDKHWLVRMPPAPLTPDIIETVDTFYRKRWQTLLAVDELIESMVIQLKRLNLYDNTYIVFTSDNGYHLGQFAMPFDKRQPYETDIRVPFIVTGPGINSKHIVEYPISLIDLVPTILDWADIEKPDDLDGQSFAELVNFESNSVDQVQTTSENSDYESTVDSPKFERQLLIEYWGEGNTDTYNELCPWNRRDRLNVSLQWVFSLIYLFKNELFYIKNSLCHKKYLQQCTPVAGCHCQDSWNNTYGCVRHIAQDLDKIYCEFLDKEVNL